VPRSLPIAILCLLAACADGESSSKDPVDPSIVSGSALPEGATTWTGSMELGGFPFLIDFELDLTGGDVRGTVSFQDDPEEPSGFGSATYRVRGTHEPSSGLLALAPYEWIEEPDRESELLGFIGAYDGETEELVGTIVDYATGMDNTLLGGPVRATLVSSDGGDPTAVGDGAHGLTVGANPFTGTTQCTGPVRDVAGTLDYDGGGAIEGTLTIGDLGVDNALGTFAATGVHNPSTGGITLVPGLWIDFNVSVLTFFVHGAHDATTGAFEGDQLTNVDACPRGLWDATVE
jgi:hypothetical protein